MSVSFISSSWELVYSSYPSRTRSITSPTESPSSSEYDFKHSPTIIISPKNQNTSDNNTTVVNFGHIITQLAENQSIDKDFIFNNHIAINAIENNQNINKLNIYQNYIYRTYSDNKYIDYIQFATNSINVNTNNFSINADINNKNNKGVL